MANRHLSRSIAMQSLYEWDFWGCKEGKLKEIVERNLKEFGFSGGSGPVPGGDLAERFVWQLLDGVVENMPKLDEIIAKSAPQWPVEQITIVDRNVLRLGLYELLFSKHEEVPPKVAINEAIELAKAFGGESSGRFVNGVLGTVYREIGEPGKEE